MRRVFGRAADRGDALDPVGEQRLSMERLLSTHREPVREMSHSIRNTSCNRRCAPYEVGKTITFDPAAFEHAVRLLGQAGLAVGQPGLQNDIAGLENAVIRVDVAPFLP
jgi:hypothetical protein